MRIADICRRDVVRIGPRTSVSEAARTMRARHVGALIVTDQPDGERVRLASSRIEMSSSVSSLPMATRARRASATR